MTQFIWQSNVNKLLQPVAGLYEKIAAVPAVTNFQQNIWPHIEKFLIAGPTLIGFIIGILKYPPRHAAFEVAFQSLVIFSGYILALVFVQTLDSLFFSGWPMVLGISRSLLAAAYVALTLMQYLPWRSGNPRMFSFTERARAKFNRALGDAP